MRALITGGYGFVGRHLARHLLDCGDDVALTYLPGASDAPGGAAENNGVVVPREVQSFALDVTDREAVNKVFTVLRPDAVYHLAGISYVPEGERNYSRVFEINAGGTLNILDAIVRHSRNTALLVVSSAEVYGSPRPGSLPLTELSELRPVTNYGLSKAAADLAAFKYHYSKDVNVVRIRPFSHLGPGQKADFAIAGFAKQIANVKLGRADPCIKVGNLEAKRDYTDVSDIVRGYREALMNGKAGAVYNFCSGNSYEIGELLNKLIALSGLEVEVVVDPARVRSVDIVELLGSYERAQRDFGWAPRVDIEVTLNTLLTYWLERLSP